MSEPAPVPLPALAPEPVVREFTVAMKIEPEDGTPGDPSVLERLRAAGYRLTFAEGSRRVLVEVPTVAAATEADAAAQAVRRVSKLVSAKVERLLVRRGTGKEVEV